MRLLYIFKDNSIAPINPDANVAPARFHAVRC